MPDWDYAGYWNAHARNVGPHGAVTHMDWGQYLEYYLPIVKRLAPRLVTSVADVGCGAGLMVPLVHWLWPTVPYHGYDVSEVMIEHCRATYDTDTFYLLAGGARLNQRYDLIFCHSVLTHITEADAGALLDEIRAALSPWGRASISIHTNCAEGLQGGIERVDYAPAHFEALLAEHSLTVLDFVDGIQRYYAVEAA